MENNPDQPQPQAPVEPQAVPTPTPAPEEAAPVEAAPTPAPEEAAPVEAAPAPAPAPVEAAPTQPVAAPAAAPAQPGTYTAVGPDGQPITYAQAQPKQPMDPATKNKIIIGSSIGGGVLLVGIIAAIVIPQFFAIDYKADYESLRSIEERLDVFSDGGSYCYHVKRMYSSDTAEEYGKYVVNCKDELAAGFQALTDLGNLRAVKNVAENKANLDKINGAIANLGYGVNDIEARLNIYKAVQGFYSVIGTTNPQYVYWSDQSDSQLEEAAAFLTESGNDQLVSFGGKWLTAAKKAKKAYDAYYKSSGGGSYSSYRDADNEYDKLCTDNDLDDLLPNFILDGVDQTIYNTAFNSIESDIYAQYLMSR